MANFVKIGKHVVNLDLVADIHQTQSAGASSHLEAVIVNFSGEAGTGLCIFRQSEPEAYAALIAWMDQQPTLIEE